MASRYYQFYNEQTKHWLKIDLRKDRVRRVSDKEFWRILKIARPKAIDSMMDILPNMVAMAVMARIVAKLAQKKVEAKT